MTPRLVERHAEAERYATALSVADEQVKWCLRTKIAPGVRMTPAAAIRIFMLPLRVAGHATWDMVRPALADRWLDLSAAAARREQEPPRRRAAR